MATQEETALKRIVHDRSEIGKGLTVHYMSKKQLHAIFHSNQPSSNVQSFYGQEQSNAEKENTSSLEEQAKTIADLKNALKDAKKRRIDDLADLSGQVKALAEKEALKDQLESKETDEQNIRLKNKQILELMEDNRSLEGKLEQANAEKNEAQKALQESTQSFNKQMAKLKTSHGQLLAEHATLQNESERLKDENSNLEQQTESLRKSTWIDIKLANEEKNEAQKALEESTQSLNEQIAKLKTSHGQLLAEHTTLQNESELKQKKLQSLEEVVRSQEERVQTMKLEARKFKTKVEDSMKDIDAKSSLIENECKERLAKSKVAYDKVRGDLVLLQEETASKDEVIKRLTSTNEDLRTQIVGNQKADDGINASDASDGDNPKGNVQVLSLDGEDEDNDAVGAAADPKAATLPADLNATLDDTLDEKMGRRTTRRGKSLSGGVASVRKSSRNAAPKDETVKSQKKQRTTGVGKTKKQEVSEDTEEDKPRRSTRRRTPARECVQPRTSRRLRERK